MTAKVDQSRCPLCGEDNQCGLQTCGAGADQFSCWCQRLVVDADLLLRLPESARGKSCICRSCLQSSQVSTEPASTKIDPASKK